METYTCGLSGSSNDIVALARACVDLFQAIHIFLTSRDLRAL